MDARVASDRRTAAGLAWVGRNPGRRPRPVVGVEPAPEEDQTAFPRVLSPLIGRRGPWTWPGYFLTENGTEYLVISHIMLITPPPEGFLSMAIVNWSTGWSRVSFLRSTRPSSLAASFFSS